MIGPSPILPTLLVTKGTVKNKNVYHVRVPGSVNSSVGGMHAVTPPRSESPSPRNREDSQSHFEDSMDPIKRIKQGARDSPRGSPASTARSVFSEASWSQDDVPPVSGMSGEDEPNEELDEANCFECSFTLKSISNRPCSVNNCTVKEEDVNVLMSLKKISVEEEDTSGWGSDGGKVNLGNHGRIGNLSDFMDCGASQEPPKKSKRKRISTRLFNEPEFEDLLKTWETNSLALGAWSMGMHALLKERFPALLHKYNYFETDKKVHLCQYLFEKSNKRKEARGEFRIIKKLNK